MNSFTSFILTTDKVMTEIILQTAEEEFLNKNFSLAYNWAISAKRLDPCYAFVDQYAEVYRIHWAAANKKTPSGEIDWYAVLNIKDRLWISYRMITHIYVKLSKKINPEFFCSVGAPGAVKLITNAWEILSEPRTRHDYHALAGLPPPTWEELPAIPLKLITLEEVNYAYHRQWEERQREKTSVITVKKVGCAHDRHRKESSETNDENFRVVLSRQLEERSEVAISKVSCAQKRCREERLEVIPKEFNCAPKRHRMEQSEITVRKVSYGPKRHRVGWSN